MKAVSYREIVLGGSPDYFSHSDDTRFAHVGNWRSYVLAAPTGFVGQGPSFSHSLTSTAADCISDTKDCRLVSLRSLLSTFYLEKGVVVAFPLANYHQRATTYLDHKSVMPYRCAVKPCGIKPREARSYNRHLPNPGPGRQATRGCLI